MVHIDEKAPNFCLKNQNNKHICLQDLAGKWVVLYFYPKDNTPGCTLEAKNFTQSSKEFSKLNATIVGISPDSVDSHKGFEEKHDIGITLLSDPDHQALNDYDVWKPKKLYGREFLGVQRSTFLIDPDGRIVQQWRKVKVQGHTKEVIETIKERQNKNQTLGGT